MFFQNLVILVLGSQELGRLANIQIGSTTQYNIA